MDTKSEGIDQSRTRGGVWVVLKVRWCDGEIEKMGFFDGGLFFLGFRLGFGNE